jgi:hypothetical protein
MAKDQNFDNDGQEFNIHLEESGELTFKANGKDGSGNTRMVIADDSGQVTIGGSGQFGQLQLKGPTEANVAFIGGTDTEVTALLGTVGSSGRMRLFDSAGHATVDLDGGAGVCALGNEDHDGDLLVLDSSASTAIRLDGDARTVELFTSGGTKRASLQGGTGRLHLLDSAEVVTADLRGDTGSLTLGASGATDGDLYLLDTAGDVTISCDGSTGHIECGSLQENSDARLKTDVAPLTRALDRVMALQGVRYRRRQGTASTAADGAARQIGFLAQEVEGVCPELVATDAEGYKSVNYTRMTAVLVEAVKEQQQLIREQAAALEVLSQRLGQPPAGGGADEPA